jgi:hypothetical protein
MRQSLESKNDKTEILEELEDKLFDEYLINEVRWGHDDAGVIIEIFTGEAEGRRLRDNLPAKWHGYYTVVITEPDIDPVQELIVELIEEPKRR